MVRIANIKFGALSFLVAFLLSVAHALAQTCPANMAACPSPTYNNLTLGGLLNANGGGNLNGLYGGAPTMLGLWTFNGGIAATTGAFTTLTAAGGTINGTTIGLTTPAAGAFTTLSTTGNLTVGGSFSAASMTLNGTGTALTVTNNASIGGSLSVTGAGTALTVTNNATIGGLLTLTGAGNHNVTGSMTFNFGGTNPLQIFQNTIQVLGSANGDLQLKANGTGRVHAFNPLYVQSWYQQSFVAAYVAGSPILNSGANNVMAWITGTLSGTVTGSGASTINYNTIADAVDASGAANGLSEWVYQTNLNTGFAGQRWGAQFVFSKNAAGAAGTASYAYVPVFSGMSITAGDGGTSGALKGDYVNLNLDDQCRVTAPGYIDSCDLAELDMRLYAGVVSGDKIGIFMNNGVGDAAHGINNDAAIEFGASATVAPGTGGWTNLIQIGATNKSLPNDPTLTNSSIMTIVLNTIGNAAGNGAIWQPNWGTGIDFRYANFTTAAFRSPGFVVDGNGCLTLGPGSVCYTTAGLSISAANVTVTGATIVAGGSNFANNDTVFGPLGDQYKATVSGGVITGLTQLHQGFGAVCPTNPVTLTGGFGVVGSATANVTCSAAASQVTVGSAGGTVNLQGTVNVDGAPIGGADGTTITTTGGVMSAFGLFCNGSDGNLTITSGQVNMTRDMCYQNVTITNGQLLPNGYVIYVNGVLDVSQAQSQAFVPSVNVASLYPVGINNRPSVAGTTGAGAAGVVATPSNLALLWGGNSQASGAGGAGTNAGGAASPLPFASTQLQMPNPFRSFPTAGTSTNGGGIYGMVAGLGGGSGGVGGGDGTNVGGASGPGGFGAGSVIIYARTIYRGTNTNQGIIQAKGNTPATNGTTPAAGNTGGGGGGAGGGGGFVYIVAGQLTGTQITGAVDVSGGNGGGGGNGFGTGHGGNGGAAGNGGGYELITLNPPAYSQGGVTWNLTGGAGGTTSTITGAAGGTAPNSRGNL